MIGKSNNPKQNLLYLNLTIRYLRTQSMWIALMEKVRIKNYFNTLRSTFNGSKTGKIWLRAHVKVYLFFFDNDFTTHLPYQCYCMELL